MKRPPAAEPDRLLQLLLRLPWIAFGLLRLLFGVVFGLATLVGAFVVLTGLILLFKGGDPLLRLGHHLEPCLEPILLEIVAFFTATTIPPTAALGEADDPAKAAVALADHLERCRPYRQTFRHPLTGDRLKREVVGLQGDRCRYIEELPGGGRMVCRYPEKMRQEVARFYRRLAENPPETVSIRIHETGSIQDARISRTVEKRVVADGADISQNPLQRALDQGICLIELQGRTEK